MNARSLTVWLAAAVTAPTALAVDPNQPLTRTVSVTGQFVAYAANPALPSAVCVFAEQVNKAWRNRLEVTNQWRDPIVFVIQSRAATATNAPAIRTEIFQTELHLKYQINCYVPPPIEESKLVAAIVEALCAEMASRDQPIRRRQPYVAPRIPAWLVAGLVESIAGRPEFLLDIARRSVDAGRPQGAIDLLNVAAPPADPLEHELFQANAWLFVEGLLAQPDGTRKLQRFLAELGATRSANTAFWSTYASDFARPVTLEKWWNLECLWRLSSGVAENLTLNETAAQLEKILPTTLSQRSRQPAEAARKQTPLAQLWRYYEQPWIRPLLFEKLNRLRLLYSRAHPLYRAVIDEYCNAIVYLTQQELNRFRREVAKADRARVRLDRTRQQVAQYLDRSERVYAPDEWAGTFHGFYRTLAQIEALERKRSNPLSDYLDKFDY